MSSFEYSTTRGLTSQKPACFEGLVSGGVPALLKTPDTEHKISEGGLRLKGRFKSDSETNPLITVVTVVFNGAEYLEDTIKSVVGQRCDNVEYVIVDGGSTDRTLEIIKKYEFAIDYWVSEPDAGVYDAMNKGIKLASGRWINFMNSGDEFFDNKVMLNVKENFVNCSVVYGGVQLVFNDCLTKVLSPPSEINFGYGLPFNHQSAFVKSELMKANLFDQRYKILADVFFFHKIFKAGYKLKPIPTTVARYDCNGISSRMSKGLLREKYLFGLTAFGFRLNILFFSIHFLNIFSRSFLKIILPSKAIDFLRRRIF